MQVTQIYHNCTILIGDDTDLLVLRFATMWILGHFYYVAKWTTLECMEVRKIMLQFV